MRSALVAIQIAASVGLLACTGSMGGEAAGGAGGNGGGGAGATVGGAGGGEGRIVLFDGTNLDQWRSVTGDAAPWRLIPDEGAMEIVPGSMNIQTKAKFDSLFVHAEYMTPMYAASVTGQARGNSGIYLKSAYELQVLDSHGVAPADDTCGAVYGIKAASASACLPQLMWNTYEIEFKGSVWNTAGVKTADAVIESASLNGTQVQDDTELDVMFTKSGVADAPGPQPLMLQEHGNPVRFRNIWVIPR